MPHAVVAAGALLLVLGAAVSYNRFVRQRQLLRESWADVDTELRRRADLVPNVVAVVKGYAAHEREVFDAIAEARAGSSRTLLAVAQHYPRLQADEHFLALQHQLVTTEDRLAAARRFFNGNVRDYNRRVDSLPSAIIARLAGFEPWAYSGSGRGKPAEAAGLPRPERAASQPATRSS
jgi:LemA protein